MKLGIINSSTRPQQQGHGIANWVMKITSEEGHDTTLLDLGAINLPLLDEPKMPMEGNYVQEHTKKWAETVSQFEGFVIVTPEYNHGYPAALKNALDTLYAEWRDKKVGLVGYGVTGAARAISHLREPLWRLNMKQVQKEVNLMLFQQLDEQGRFAPSEHDAAELKKMIQEMNRSLG